MYRNYLFDLYGTLLDIRTEEETEDTWSAFAALLTENGMPYSGKEAYGTFERERKKLLCAPSSYHWPEYDLQPAFRSLCRNKRPDADEKLVWSMGEAFRRLSVKRIGLYPDALKLLTKLREKGKRVFLLSNAQLIYTRQELEQFDLPRYFDDIFISSVYGCMKPDPVFFDAPVKKYALRKEECVMIGNDPFSDAGGAKNAGMDCVFLKTDDGDYPLPDCRYVFPDGALRHVLELEE